MKLTSIYSTVLVSFLFCSSLYAAQSMTSEESEFWSKAKKSVEKKLKDPESARYRNLLFTKSKMAPFEVVVVCGEVNAKNSFGGYAGFGRFSAMADGAYLDSEKGGSIMVNVMCK